MVRMWNVPPEELCDQHLLGEHSEMHIIVGSIRNHQHGEAILRGHARRGQIKSSLIQERHDELADELENRGFNHDSPLSYDDEFDVGFIDVDESRHILKKRCGSCKRRMESK